MADRSLDSLGRLQRKVMEIIWELGEASVNDVRARLGRRKPPAYTTVLSVMQKLEKGGWLAHREEGRAYVYLPTCTRDEASRGCLRQFVESVFGGNPLAVFQHLLDDEQITSSDLAALRKMIDQRRKEQQR